MTRYRFSMVLPAHQLDEYYRGTVRYVVVQSDQGSTLQIPLNALRRFVTRDGIHGHFVVEVDDKRRLISLERV